ncbi:hypothetical protein, conserved [Entamoeba dispar SAW760]|uniref:Uncharacterized protein n=1 Tax=Entamoeba dispar (strain ATCC PRA-260 / SAW760) TaxID=370354 RepID=B0ETW4_ENTDS|nr:uncharacterized protein EDI_201680 [Entamoeba dispar SAW760]EDR22052.1 hypothetical protein, conserved [Entamoeba dispar SAW760]|eukprot:EDR22052.1 hypothetical protein, conserved [Entamoeba dispar SAW760]
MYQLALTIKDYKEDIHLLEEVKKSKPTNTSWEILCNEIVEELLKKKINDKEKSSSWEIYRSIMNQIDPVECQELCKNNKLMDLISQMLQLKNKDIVDSKEIITLKEQGHSFLFSDKLALWKGDITKLSVDSIVNAANNQLLGCFVPHHLCIDNAIHTFAGPQLRRDCFIIMEKQQFEEPTGYAKITRAYNLPSKYIIHTVGPIVKSKLKESHCNLLRSSYINCLNIADDLHLESIAFSCISTGIFGFPQNIASMIAIETIINWLYENPFTSIKKVIFDVFSDNDLQIYKKSLTEFDKSYNEKDIMIPPKINTSIMVTPTEIQQNELNRVIQFFKDATHIIIGAGAGLSVDAGLSFMDTKLFSEMGYPLFEYGINSLYQTMGFEDFKTENQKWGFYAVMADYMRYKEVSEHEFDTYKKLLDLLKKYNKNYFVKTTNVDGLFERSGYDMNKFFNPQGDFKYIQCSTPCTQDVYLFKPYMDKIFENMNPLTFEVPDSCIPKCPKCGKEMTQNLRSDELFVEKPHMVMAPVFTKYVEDGIKNGKVLFIEFGVGGNTPIHIRIPFENWTIQGKNTMLVRINLDKSFLQSKVTHTKYSAFHTTGKQFVEWLWKAMK